MYIYPIFILEILLMVMVLNLKFLSYTLQICSGVKFAITLTFDEVQDSGRLDGTTIQ